MSHTELVELLRWIERESAAGAFDTKNGHARVLENFSLYVDTPEEIDSQLASGELSIQKFMQARTWDSAKCPNVGDLTHFPYLDAAYTILMAEKDEAVRKTLTDTVGADVYDRADLAEIFDKSVRTNMDRFDDSALTPTWELTFANNTDRDLVDVSVHVFSSTTFDVMYTPGKFKSIKARSYKTITVPWAYNSLSERFPASANLDILISGDFPTVEPPLLWVAKVEKFVPVPRTQYSYSDACIPLLYSLVKSRLTLVCNKAELIHPVNYDYESVQDLWQTDLRVAIDEKLNETLAGLDVAEDIADDGTERDQSLHIGRLFWSQLNRDPSTASS